MSFNPGHLSTELQVFSELARAAAGPSSVDGILGDVCHELGRAFGFTQVDVALVTRDRSQLERFPFLGAARGNAAASVHAETDTPFVVVPLRSDVGSFGFIVCEGTVGEQELDILTAFGRMTALVIAKTAEHRALEQEMEELRRLDGVKTDFVSVASHELRSPMAVVHGIASTLHLRGSELREDQLAMLQATLHRQTTRVVELVEKLLDLSQLEAGALALAPERFRPRERIDALLPNIAPDRLADLRVEIAHELELYTDPHAVERVLANLVLNALHHGRPPVCVRNVHNGALQLVVEDSGPGVEPAFVPYLFDRFTRSASAGDHGTHGAGLGLSIAQSYARAIGGELRYEPVEPSGARFTFSLPADAVAA